MYTADPDRRGFALPAALLTLIILGVLTTTGLFSARQELHTGTAGERATEALYIAESGLTQVMDEWRSQDLAGVPVWGSVTYSDTTSYGIWTVSVTKGTDRLFYLESEGEVTRGGASASRRVGMIARVRSAVFEPRSALMTRGNASVRGNAEVHGEDQHPPNWAGVCTGPLNDKPGIIINDSTAVGTVGQGQVTGSPAVQADPTLTTDSFREFGEMDWEEVTALADKVSPPGSINNTFPADDGAGHCYTGLPYNWGDPTDPTAPCGGYFPIIHVPGDLHIQSGGVGQGILLVDGDLDLRGGFVFHGIIIAQGNFETQGSGNRVFGAVLASNADFDNQSLVGGSVVQYSSCAVSQAIENNPQLNRARPLRSRAWVDASAVRR